MIFKIKLFCISNIDRWLLSLFSCLVVSNSFVTPMDCSPPGSNGPWDSPGKKTAISFCRGSSWPRDQTQVSCFSRWILYHWATREARYMISSNKWKEWVVRSELFSWSHVPDPVNSLEACSEYLERFSPSSKWEKGFANIWKYSLAGVKNEREMAVKKEN